MVRTRLFMCLAAMVAAGWLGCAIFLLYWFLSPGKGYALRHEFWWVALVLPDPRNSIFLCASIAVSLLFFLVAASIAWDARHGYWDGRGSGHNISAIQNPTTYERLCGQTGDWEPVNRSQGVQCPTLDL